MPISINLENVGFGVADLPCPPDTPKDERPKLLQFHDEKSGINVNVPMTAGAMDQLGAQIRGSQVEVARGVPAGVDLRRGPAPGQGPNGRGR